MSVTERIEAEMDLVDLVAWTQSVPVPPLVEDCDGLTPTALDWRATLANYVVELWRRGPWGEA